jgi:hypothetical protein
MKQSLQRRLLTIEQDFFNGRDEQGRTPADIPGETTLRRSLRKCFHAEGASHETEAILAA